MTSIECFVSKPVMKEQLFQENCHTVFDPLASLKLLTMSQPPSIIQELKASSSRHRLLNLNFPTHCKNYNQHHYIQFSKYVVILQTTTSPRLEILIRLIWLAKCLTYIHLLAHTPSVIITMMRSLNARLNIWLNESEKCALKSCEAMISCL